jgi:uncharacterized surface protein with fasciclin (FAS1) repeats
MKNIPTAKAFYQNYIEENNHDSHVDIEEMLIEFAKLHVEAALKEAMYKADEKEMSSMQVNDYYREEILNSYPLDKIK